MQMSLIDIRTAQPIGSATVRIPAAAPPHAWTYAPTVSRLAAPRLDPARFWVAIAMPFIAVAVSVGGVCAAAAGLA
jgi:hypothetical protein